MCDEVQRGWLDGEDYRVVAEAAGVAELPDAPDGSDEATRAVLEEVSTGRWEDSTPPGIGR